MNKIFKVVWNKARGCYVVASEFAKSRTKSGRAAKAAAVAVAAGLTLGMNGLALAAGTIEDIPKGEGDGLAIGENSKATNANDTAVGENATADGAKYILYKQNEDGTKTLMEEHLGNATAIGNEAQATMANSTAVGVKAQALTVSSTALGMGAKANGAQYITEDGIIHVGDATAVGVNAQALGAGSTALGVGVKALAYNSTALGIGSSVEESSTNSTAIGNAKVGENAKNSIAIGNGAKVGNDNDDTISAIGSIAIGSGATVTRAGSTALGVGARADGVNSISLSNGAKAYGDSSIAAGNSAEAYGYGSVALGHLTIAGNEDTSAKTMYAIAVGDRAHASDLYSIAIGYTSRATGDNSVAQGRRAVALDDNTIAIGYNAQAGSGTVTWSDDGYSSSISNSSSTDAQYAMAIGYSAKANANSSVAIGSSAQASSANNVALGASSNDSGGKKGYADKTNSKEIVFALSNNALEITLSQFAGTGNSVVGTVSVGSAGNERTLTNVAAGMISATSTDAINGSQLYAVAEGLQDQIDTINTKIDSSTGGGTNHDHTVNGNDNQTNPGQGTLPPTDGSYSSNDGNLLIKKENTTYDISLNPDLKLDSVTFGDTINNTVVINKEGMKFDDSHYITNNTIQMGDTVIKETSITTNEVNIGDISIKDGNVNMGDNQIHNIQAGTADTDAVNYGQLKQVEKNVINNSVQINKLGRRIDRVGAGAAALAALHPLDFDPDDKFYLSAGFGNYRGENAVAVGAFYQPNDDTLLSVSSTVGNDDDMINAGVTWRFGQSSNQSRSKKAMAKEIIELRTRLASLEAMIYSMAGAGLDPEKSKLFPDTPENHWAYDYVAVVAGNGILEGYPNGQFDGSRPMTRYEMAAVVYRMLQKGVQVDNRMLMEFAPELARVRVDTLTHYNDGTPHIQRVRVIEGRG